jgi:isocitrate/isopropylmalate dehydrogenase
VLASAMMMEFLGWQREASAIRAAVKSALFNNHLTSDLGGACSTAEVGTWLAEFATTHLA